MRNVLAAAMTMTLLLAVQGCDGGDDGCLVAADCPVERSCVTASCVDTECVYDDSTCGCTEDSDCPVRMACETVTCQSASCVYDGTDCMDAGFDGGPGTADGGMSDAGRMELGFPGVTVMGACNTNADGSYSADLDNCFLVVDSGAMGDQVTITVDATLTDVTPTFSAVDVFAYGGIADPSPFGVATGLRRSGENMTLSLTQDFGLLDSTTWTETEASVPYRYTYVSRFSLSAMTTEAMVMGREAPREPLMTTWSSGSSDRGIVIGFRHGTVHGVSVEM